MFELSSLLTPISYSDGILLPQGAGTPKRGRHFRGKISKDSSFLYTHSLSVVQCLPLRRASTPPSTLVCTTPYHVPPAVHIKAVVDFSFNGAPQLLLLLALPEENGAACLFCVRQGLITKRVDLPSPALTGCLLSSSLLHSNFDLHPVLLSFVGSALVGLKSGAVVVLDLSLDSRGKGEEGMPLTFLGWENEGAGVALERHEIVGDGGAVGVKLAGEKFGKAPTCTAYFEPGILAFVGFDDGSWQVYELGNGTLIHMSLICDSPVFGFSFTTPVDDPKPVAFAWIMYGREGLEFGECWGELTCLEFNEASFKNISSVTKRLTLPFPDTAADSDFVRPISLQTISRSLTAFSFESSLESTFYIGLFDLDQWYSQRMIDAPRRLQPSDLCPFFSVVTCHHSENFGLPIVQVTVDPASIERFSDMHQARLALPRESPVDFVAGVSFDATILTHASYSYLTHFGVQERVLRKLGSDEGTNLMMEPASLRKLMRGIGLKPEVPLSHGFGDHFLILTTLLDTLRPAVIIHFAASWMDGAYASHGLTLDLVLDWATTYTKILREMGTDHWTSILNRRTGVTPEVDRFLHYSYFAFSSLLGIVETIGRCEAVVDVRSKPLKNLTRSLQKLIQYSACLLMLYKAGALPDCRNLIEGLRQNHQVARRMQQEALSNGAFLDDKLRTTPSLITSLLSAIQGVRDHLFVEIDPENVENIELYPPTNLGMMLNLLFIENKNVDYAVAYFLIDLKKSFNLCLTGDFTAILNLTETEQSYVYHLWALDHCYEPEIRDEVQSLLPTMPWSSSHLPIDSMVILGTGFSLLDEDFIVELLTERCPEGLERFFLNVMNANGSYFEALLSSKPFPLLSTDSDFAELFFEKALNSKLLPDFASKIQRYPHLREPLTSFLQRLDSQEGNRILLNLYSTLKEYGKLGDLLDKMRASYFLSDEERWRLSLWDRVLRWEQAEAEEVWIFPDQKDGTIKKPVPQVKKLNPLQVPKTPVQRVKELARKSIAFSPLRKYARRMQQEFFSSPAAVSKDKSQMATSLTSRLGMVVDEEEEEELEFEVEQLNSSKSSKSGWFDEHDMSILLRPVDCSVSIIPDSGEAAMDHTLETCSILKKADSKRKEFELRFLGDEDESPPASTSSQLGVTPGEIALPTSPAAKGRKRKTSGSTSASPTSSQPGTSPSQRGSLSKEPVPKSEPKRARRSRQVSDFQQNLSALTEKEEPGSSLSLLAPDTSLDMIDTSVVRQHSSGTSPRQRRSVSREPQPKSESKRTRRTPQVSGFQPNLSASAEKEEPGSNRSLLESDMSSDMMDTSVVRQPSRTRRGGKRRGSKASSEPPESLARSSPLSSPVKGKGKAKGTKKTRNVSQTSLIAEENDGEGKEFEAVSGLHSNLSELTNKEEPDSSLSLLAPDKSLDMIDTSVVLQPSSGTSPSQRRSLSKEPEPKRARRTRQVSDIQQNLSALTEMEEPGSSLSLLAPDTSLDKIDTSVVLQPSSGTSPRQRRSVSKEPEPKKARRTRQVSDIQQNLSTLTEMEEPGSSLSLLAPDTSLDMIDTSVVQQPSSGTSPSPRQRRSVSKETETQKARRTRQVSDFQQNLSTLAEKEEPESSLSLLAPDTSLDMIDTSVVQQPSSGTTPSPRQRRSVSKEPEPKSESKRTRRTPHVSRFQPNSSASTEKEEPSSSLSLLEPDMSSDMFDASVVRQPVRTRRAGKRSGSKASSEPPESLATRSPPLSSPVKGKDKAKGPKKGRNVSTSVSETSLVAKESDEEEIESVSRFQPNLSSSTEKEQPGSSRSLLEPNTSLDMFDTSVVREPARTRKGGKRKGSKALSEPPESATTSSQLDVIQTSGEITLPTPSAAKGRKRQSGKKSPRGVSEPPASTSSQLIQTPGEIALPTAPTSAKGRERKTSGSTSGSPTSSQPGTSPRQRRSVSKEPEPQPKRTRRTRQVSGFQPNLSVLPEKEEPGSSLSLLAPDTSSDMTDTSLVRQRQPSRTKRGRKRSGSKASSEPPESLARSLPSSSPVKGKGKAKGTKKTRSVSSSVSETSLVAEENDELNTSTSSIRSTMSLRSSSRRKAYDL